MEVNHQSRGRIMEKNMNRLKLALKKLRSNNSKSGLSHSQQSALFVVNIGAQKTGTLSLMGHPGGTDKEFSCCRLGVVNIQIYGGAILAGFTL